MLDSTSPGEVLTKLYDRGVDAGQAAQAGQIEVETPANAYFRPGTFSADDILTFWGQGISKAKDSGMFAYLRTTGEMPSVLNHRDVVLRLYDLDGMGAEVLMQALRTYPAVIVDGMIPKNPYYIEPSRFLAQIW